MTIRHIRKCDRCKREEGTAAASPHPVSGTWVRLMVTQGQTVVFPDPPEERQAEADLCLGCFESLKRWWYDDENETAEVDSSLPPLAVRAVGRVLAHGGAKRGSHDSYLTDGRPVTRHAAALSRHFAAAAAGEVKDEESGAHPLAHVVGRGLIALELILRGHDATVVRGGEDFAKEEACVHTNTTQDSSGFTCLDCGKDWFSG